MSILDSLPDIVHKSFRSIFKKGKLVKKTFSFDKGRAIAVEDPEVHDILLIREDLSELRRAIGQESGSFKFIIIKRSIPNSIEITTEDSIIYENHTYKIQSIDNEDPSGSVIEVLVTNG